MSDREPGQHSVNGGRDKDTCCTGLCSLLHMVLDYIGFRCLEDLASTSNSEQCHPLPSPLPSKAWLSHISLSDEACSFFLVELCSQSCWPSNLLLTTSQAFCHMLITHCDLRKTHHKPGLVAFLSMTKFSQEGLVWVHSLRRYTLSWRGMHSRGEGA